MEINGVQTNSDPKENTRMVLSLFPDIQYWSKDALEKLYIAGLEIGIEAAKDWKGGGKFIGDAHRKIRTFIKRSPRMDHPWVLRKIYDEILRLEGLGTLPGFGFTNRFGDRLVGNSEKQSVQEKVDGYIRLSAPKEELLMADLKRSELKAIAKELNEVLGIEPPIDLTQSAKNLQATILKAAELIDPEGDEFSKVTTAGLETLGCLKKQEPKEPKEPKEPEEEPEEEEEEEEPEEEEEEEEPEEEEEEEEDTPDLPRLVADTKKLKDLKNIINKYDEFKKLRKGLDAYQGLSGPRELKPAMFKTLGVDPPVTKPTSEKKTGRVSKEKSRFGHMKGTSAARLDEALADETPRTMDDLVKIGECPKSRIMGYFYGLKKKGYTVTIDKRSKEEGGSQYVVSE